MKKFFKLVVDQGHMWDGKPEWARDEQCKIISEDKCIVNTRTTLFYQTEEEREQRILWIEKDNEARISCGNVDEIEKIIYKGTSFFEEEFIDEVLKYRERIANTGEFSFEFRKKIRRECREKLAPLSLEKRERQDKLSFIRQFV